MSQLANFFKSFSGVLDFTNLPQEYRKVTFYSEGKNYWAYLYSIINTFLTESDIHISYLTSSFDDPAFNLKHDRFHIFYIGDGIMRNHVFKNLNTDIMVMTMPDLEQYQVKRSIHKVHYVYVQHSLVSLHMVYRFGAFDHYDTIACCGEYHINEVRALEKKYNLPEKNILKLGYTHIDNLLKLVEERKNISVQNETEKKKSILLAPSWGEYGILETGLAEKLVTRLLELDYKVILRPHPQTLKLNPQCIHPIVEKHKNNEFFTFENHIASQESLYTSDLMISDWSGVALEYAFAFKKPVIFCDIPRKVNNKQYEEIDCIPFEVSIREKIGTVWNTNEDIKNSLEKCEKINSEILTQLLNENIFNIGKSDKVFADFLKSLLSK